MPDRIETLVLIFIGYICCVTSQSVGAEPIRNPAQHVIEAALHLERAGLTAEANALRVRGLDSLIALRTKELEQLDAELTQREIEARKRQQIHFDVLIAELSLSQLREHGIGESEWHPIRAPLSGNDSPDWGIAPTTFVHEMRSNSDFIKRLKELNLQGLLEVLARPNISAISGMEATVRVGTLHDDPSRGGEIDSTSIKAGVSLTVNPVVTADGWISTRLAIWMSEDDSQSISGHAVDIRGRGVISMNTHVTLMPGETVVLGGIRARLQASVNDSNAESHGPDEQIHLFIVTPTLVD